MATGGWKKYLVVLWLASGCARAASVTIDTGALAGRREDAVDVYRGIPFASPPVGVLRWRSPQPAPAWHGVRDAGKFAAACMQQGVSMPGETPPTVSEDCLYLNIWAPPRSKGEGGGVPVIVWIHGGGYTNGSASMPLYHGDRLARQGVLVVTIAYRLGALGFLAHPALSDESSHRSSGNYGLMDQIAALQWVQRNIAQFGGDPRRVTIAGQSAGAMAISALLASPRTEGLFQRAIAQSGGIFEPLQLAPGYLLANAECDGAGYMKSLGADTLAEMRALPAERLAGPNGVSHPVIEPDVLPLSPYDAYVQGRYRDVPLLLGSNTEEAQALVDVGPVRAESFEADIARSFGALPPALLAAYPHATDQEARASRLGFERDLRFGWDMWAWARLAQKGSNPVYYYSFAHRPPFPADSVYAGWGAGHFAELWYMFDHLGQFPWAWSRADHQLAAQISGYWVHFASSGDPNHRGAPRWPAFRGTLANVQRLGSPISAQRVPALEQLQVFDAVYAQLRGKAFGLP